MDQVGQLQPNATARFTPVTMEEALAARHDREILLNEIRESF
jgi:allophanate hydrolase subunit 2